IDVLGDLCRDLTGKIGADAGNQRGRNDGPGLQHKGRRRRHDTIERHGAPVHRSVEEGEIVVLRGPRLVAETEPSKIWCRGLPRGTRCGLEEDPAGARRFLFGKPSLFLRIDGWRVDRWRRNRLSTLLSVEDRSAEIAGKWRAEHRTGVVAGQLVQS